jgi:pimeloyl-ACP methyl ester carboxylesterase
MQASETVALEFTEHNEKIAGTETFWRSLDPIGNALPTLYVHGSPTNSDDWLPFLAKTGGVALDLPGFGRSEKPRFFDYSIGGYNAFLQAFVGQLGWEKFNVVVHDWGALALVTAQELHDRIGQVVIINAVPLLPGYRWHRLARGWRTPILGEFMMGTTTKAVVRYLLKEARPDRQPMPREFVDSMWDHFDQGTQSAILKLYRSAPPKILEQAGERFSRLTAPALVVWGEQDPYIPTSFAQAYVDALPNAELKLLPDAGHWPWIDRPDVTLTVAEFLLGGNTST